MQQELFSQDDIIYEDDIVMAGMAQNPATKGHVIVIPKKNAKSLDALSEDECERLFVLTNYIATTLFETLGAHGTNVLVNETERLRVDILARVEGDNLNFQWEPKQWPEEDLKSVTSRIADNIVMGEDRSSDSVPSNTHDSSQASNPPSMKSSQDDQDSQEDDMMVKHLLRIP